MTARSLHGLDRLLEIATFLAEDMASDLAGRYGLTQARTVLIWDLHHHGPSTQRALASRLRVSPRNVTGLVDALAASGFVTREPHPSDRRATLVTLTARGTSVCEELVARRRELADALFAGMPDGRLDAFVRGLDEVMERLRELGDGPPGP